MLAPQKVVGSNQPGKVLSRLQCAQAKDERTANAVAPNYCPDGPAVLLRFEARLNRRVDYKQAILGHVKKLKQILASTL